MSISAVFNEIVSRIDRGRATTRLQGLKPIRVADDPSKQGKADLPVLSVYSLGGNTSPWNYGGGGRNAAITQTVRFTFILAVDRDRSFTNLSDPTKPKGLLDWVNAIFLEVESAEVDGELVADAAFGDLLSEAIQFEMSEEEPTNIASSCSITMLCQVQPRCRGVLVEPEGD